MSKNSAGGRARRYRRASLGGEQFVGGSAGERRGRRGEKQVRGGWYVARRYVQGQRGRGRRRLELQQCGGRGGPASGWSGGEEVQARVAEQCWVGWVGVRQRLPPGRGRAARQKSATGGQGQVLWIVGLLVYRHQGGSVGAGGKRAACRAELNRGELPKGLTTWVGVC